MFCVSKARHAFPMGGSCLVFLKQGMFSPLKRATGFIAVSNFYRYRLVTYNYVALSNEPFSRVGYMEHTSLTSLSKSCEDLNATSFFPST